MRPLKLAFTLIIILSALVACNQKKPQNSDSKELPQITLGVMPSMDYLPLAVAEREGYFEKHGVDVVIKKFVSANERDMAFQASSVDGGVTDYTSAALLKNGGFDMKLVSKCQAPFYIIASEQSGVKSVSDMKGKKVAVSQNTVIDFCVDMALKNAGMSDTDIEKVEVNKIPLRFEMLRNGKIDATALPAPFGLIAKNDGCNIVFTIDQLDYAITGIVFSQKAIEEKADAIKKMYAAYNDGVAYLNKQTVEDIKDILVKDMNFPENVVKDFELPTYVNVQAVKAADKDITAVVEWLGGKKLLSESFKVEELLDTQFAE